MSEKNVDLFSLQKDTPVPLYYQIKKSILKAIQDGRLKGGDMLPSELEFCDQCGVSRPTIRQALSELVADGYLYRMKGRGTFISIPKIEDRFLNKLQSFNQEMQQKGLRPSTKVLKICEISGKEAINEKLGLAPEDSLIYLERLRYANDEPIVYLETYLPYETCKGLLDENLEELSLYGLLQQRHGLHVVRVMREIEAINASAREASLLGISKNKALCLVRTVAYAERDVPVEYSVARYRGDRNKFSVELQRD